MITTLNSFFNLLTPALLLPIAFLVSSHVTPTSLPPDFPPQGRGETLVTTGITGLVSLVQLDASSRGSVTIRSSRQHV